MRPSPWAVGTFLLWVVVSVTVRDGFPFLKFPAFQFPSAGGATAVPLVLADGEDVDLTRLEHFVGISPEEVDVRHQGVACSMEHRLYENRQWVADHLATEGRPEGPVEVSIGLRIVAVDEEGWLQIRDRVDATGTASWR